MENLTSEYIVYYYDIKWICTGMHLINMQKNIHVLQTMNKFETIKDHCNPPPRKTTEHGEVARGTSSRGKRAARWIILIVLCSFFDHYLLPLLSGNWIFSLWKFIELSVNHNDAQLLYNIYSYYYTFLNV